MTARKTYKWFLICVLLACGASPAASQMKNAEPSLKSIIASEHRTPKYADGAKIYYEESAVPAALSS